MEKLEETTASTAWYDEEAAMGGEVERWKERDKVGRGDCGEESHAHGWWRVATPKVPVAVARREISSKMSGPQSNKTF